MTAVDVPEQELLGDDRGPRDALTGLLDIVVVISSACVVAASLGSDDLIGRQWIALVFFLLGPGWAFQRRAGAVLGAESLFVAVGSSLATVALAGHVTVTILDWHWAPVMVLLASATGATVAVQRWRTDVTGTSGPRTSVDRPVADPVEAGWLGARAWWVVVSVGVVAALFALGGLAGASTGDVDGYGLISAIPTSTWIGGGVVLLCAVAVLGPRPRDHAALAGLLALAALVIHGAPGIIEPHPRFPVAWLHTGFIDQISQNGVLLRDLDARFSWPGFFAGGALLDQVAGTDGTLWLIRFAPVFLTLLTCLGLWVLGRRLGFDAVPCGAAALGYLMLNWAGQDYFSPQGMAFILYLTVLVLTLRWFPGAGPASDSLLGRLLRSSSSDESPADVRAPADPTTLRWRVLAIVGLSSAIIVSHQLTPGFLTIVLLGLGLTGLISLRWLGVMVALLTVAWLSFGGETWWLGHLDTLTGSVGDVGSIVEENVSERSGGASEAREVLLQARLGLSAVVWLTTAALLLRSWWRGPSRATLVLAVLTAAPFPLLAAQPYGGELVIRIYFFVLPPAVLVLVLALVPDDAVSALRRGLFGLALVALLPLLMLARFGNEEFEMVLDEDRTVADTLMAEAPRGSTVFIANGQALVNFERVGELRYRSLYPPAAEEVIGFLEGADPDEGRFVYLSRPQDLYLQQTESRPVGWMEELGDDLIDTDRFIVHRHGPTGSVLEFLG